ncbi:unnamed protein product [Pieris brassicae]|uniref:Uncharacterized protein n=1 Tax=Pieris brassicae TaxID=7116 RepID=A0A9P0XJ08_PIEBR|nr:unnamed protein product [Pieris brassicae]
MVLSTESTIRELCPSNTPTSQFSSLHFIASKAIGAKSIERRAQTLDTRSFGRQYDARVPARFGADCRSAGGFHTADDEREYLTGVDTTPRTAQRWVATEYAPLPLPHCHDMGTRPRYAKALRGHGA